MHKIIEMILKNMEFRVFFADGENDPYKIFMSKDGVTYLINEYKDIKSVFAWIGNLQNGTITYRDKVVNLGIEELTA